MVGSALGSGVATADRPVAWLALFAILTLFAAALARNFVSAFPLAGADESEHLITARSLAERGTATFRPADPYEYVNLNLIEGIEGGFHGKHPFGYPLLCALAYRLGGPDAPFWVNPAAALLGLLGLFGFARMLAGPWAGVVATALLAANPLYGAYALSAMTHSTALAFTIWGLFFVWRWSRNGNLASALLGGLLCGIAATIRYAEVLLALPIAVAVLARFAEARAETDPGRRHAALRACVGGAAGIGVAALLAYAPLMLHQWVAYGSPFTSGQSITESSGLGLQNWPRNTGVLAAQLLESGLLPMFALGLTGLVLLASRRTSLALFLASWALVHFGLYHSFYWRDAKQYVGDMRYYLDLFPPLALAATTATVARFEGLRTRAIALGVLVLAVVPAGAIETSRIMAAAGRVNLRAEEIWRIVRDSVPDGSVIFTDEDFVSALAYLGDYRVYYDPMFHPQFLRDYEPLLAHDRPWPISRRRIRGWKALLGGRSEADLAETERALVSQHLAAGRQVFFLTRGNYLQDWRDRLGASFTIATRLERPLYMEAGPDASSGLMAVHEIRVRALPGAAQPSSSQR